MSVALEAFSTELAKLAESAAAGIVSVRGRRRYPSSGIRWGEGTVVTAAHALAREEEIEVTLADGRIVGATLTGRDPGSDLAVLKVEGAGAPPAWKPAAAAHAGELALVAGRSADSGINLSLGIVSAASGEWRTWRGGRLSGYVRLDARMFPQSSGGAVLNMRGELIGVATPALSRLAGLAVPAADVARIAGKLLATGSLPRGYLGIGGQTVALPQAAQTRLKLDQESGVMVVQIEPDGPAEAAGLMLGDVLVTLDGTPAERVEDLLAATERGTAGKRLAVRALRAGALVELTVTLGERPQA